MPNKIRDKIKKYLRLTNKQYTIPEIQKNVEKAINLLFLWDFFLLKNGVNERAVSHKLAEYLQTLFKGWNVDCEYNKKGLNPKELDGIKGCNEQKNRQSVPRYYCSQKKYEGKLAGCRN